MKIYGIKTEISRSSVADVGRHESGNLVIERYNQSSYLLEMGEHTQRFHFISSVALNQLAMKSGSYKRLKAENEALQSKLRVITTIIGS